MQQQSVTRLPNEHPIQRHRVYGVNCYQHAIGHSPITVYFNQYSNKISYLTLCPGQLAKNLYQKTGANALKTIPAYEAKKMIIAGCQEDGLEELETRSLADAIHIPTDKKLIALFFSAERGDFDFHVFHKATRKWENKTPFAPMMATDYLPKIIAGGYVLTRLFVAADKIEPKGVIAGETYRYYDGTVLNLPSCLRPWESGASLVKTVSGDYELMGKGAFYPPPDLSFLNITDP